MKRFSFILASALIALCAQLNATTGLVVSGSDLIYTVDAGATQTEASALPEGTRLLKRGEGELILTAATSATLSQGVFVEEGTLSIKHNDALGTSAAITVRTGASFIYRVAKSAGTNAGTARLFPGHAIHLAGTGVNGQGALQYVPDSYGSGYADNCFESITLLDDATIRGTKRFGFGQGPNEAAGILNLQNHTLTYSGTAELMFHRVQVPQPGVIDISGSSADITLQDAVQFCSTPTVGTIRLRNKGILGLWKMTRAMPWNIEIDNGRIRAGDGSQNQLTGTITILSHGGVHETQKRAHASPTKMLSRLAQPPIRPIFTCKVTVFTIIRDLFKPSTVAST